MKNLKIKSEIKNLRQKGFTLLMSLLVISIILSIGMGVSDIVIRETKISGVGRESQVAFSAADAGAECAFFWEIKHPGMIQSAFNSANTVNCAGNSVSNSFSGNVSNFILNLGNNSCVNVKVDKASSPTQTIIESRGYNTNCASISPFRVERAIRLTLNKIAPTGYEVFDYTGDVQTFTVPSGVARVTITACGAQGSRGEGGGSGAGGAGGRTQGNVPVAGGNVLGVYVGGSSGYNGGGLGSTSATDGGNGGGASDVRIGVNKIIVAGGGGGGGGADNNRGGGAGGEGGGYTGGSGSGGGAERGGASGGGGGGSQNSGGAGNQVGSLGFGGNALTERSAGGGGGYFGGGAANRSGTSAGGGGGGGSSYVPAGGTTESGVCFGNGQVIIEY